MHEGKCSAILGQDLSVWEPASLGCDLHEWWFLLECSSIPLSFLALELPIYFPVVLIWLLLFLFYPLEWNINVTEAGTEERLYPSWGKASNLTSNYKDSEFRLITLPSPRQSHKVVFFWALYHKCLMGYIEAWPGKCGSLTSGLWFLGVSYSLTVPHLFSSNS